MKDILLLVIVLLVWIALQKFILPRFGIQT